jgi:hypothetical protein
MDDPLTPVTRTDTAAVPGLEVGSVASWLAGLGIDTASATAHRIGDGQSTITCLVTDGTGRRLVVRRPPLGDRLGSAHDVVREARILGAGRHGGSRAAICQGILQRVQNDDRNRGLGWTPTRATVDNLVDHARRVADDVGL